MTPPENVTASSYCAVCGRAQGGPWADHTSTCTVPLIWAMYRRALGLTTTRGRAA